MSEFCYTGRTGQGLVEGRVEAASASGAADLLFARGVTPLKIYPASPSAVNSDSAALPWRKWLQPKVQTVDKLLFSRQIHSLLKAGVPILSALAGLQEAAVNAQMKQTLLEVRQSLSSGIELSMSMSRYPKVFNSFYVALVRVGEMTGQLDEVFLRLFHHIEFELFMSQQVKSALRYPMFVIVAMALAMGVINVMVIPAFASVFQNLGTQLPLATRLLMAISAATLQYGWLILLSSIAAVFFVRRWIATPAGRLTWDRYKLAVPIAGKIIQKATLARFARSFALSMKSGVPIEQALSVVSTTVDNSYVSQQIEGMRLSIEHGDTILRAAMDTGVFTPIVLQMIAVGEETGAIDDMMNEVAELYTNDVHYDLKQLAQQIEPVLIAFLGVLVLVLALGVFLPVWDLGSAALKH